MKSRYHLLLLILLTLIFLSIFFLSAEFRVLVYRGSEIDTIAHLLSFLVLTWILHNILKLPLFISALTLSFYAALTEIGQYFLGFRTGEFSDFFADIIGIVLFIIIHRVILVYRHFTKSEE